MEKLSVLGTIRVVLVWVDQQIIFLEREVDQMN